MSCRPSVCAVSWKLFGACIPLYSVVRIHGSVGWKSWRQFSSYLETVIYGMYQFLCRVSSPSRLDSVRGSSPLTLSDRANSCLCCRRCVSYFFTLQPHVSAHGVVPLHRDALWKLVVGAERRGGIIKTWLLKARLARRSWVINKSNQAIALQGMWIGRERKRNGSAWSCGQVAVALLRCGHVGSVLPAKRSRDQSGSFPKE